MIGFEKTDNSCAPLVGMLLGFISISGAALACLPKTAARQRQPHAVFVFSVNDCRIQITSPDSPALHPETQCPESLHLGVRVNSSGRHQ